MSEPKSFGQLTKYTPLFEEVVKHFAARPLKGRQHGDRRRKRSELRALDVAAVYGRIWRRCDSGSPDGRCYLGTRRIEADTGVPKTTVARAEDALCEAGFLIDCSGDFPNRKQRTFRIPQGQDSAIVPPRDNTVPRRDNSVPRRAKGNKQETSVGNNTPEPEGFPVEEADIVVVQAKVKDFQRPGSRRQAFSRRTIEDLLRRFGKQAVLARIDAALARDDVISLVGWVRRALEENWELEPAERGTGYRVWDEATCEWVVRGVTT